MTPQEFKLAVKHRLLDLGMTQADMIREVSKRTGKYLDSSYMKKIYDGKNHPKEILAAIREILDLPEE